MGLDRAEVITAFCAMLHSVLYQMDSQLFASVKSVVESVDAKLQHRTIAMALADLFLARFDPKNPLSDAEFESRSKQIQATIEPLGSRAGKLVLTKLREAVHSTLRTNFYNESRYALSMRMDPSIMFLHSGNAG
jgi:NAD-specific glutamate dehydrogenase